MKLAIVRQRYNPYGGAERFVERALGALSGNGLNLTLITRVWPAAKDDLEVRLCNPFYLGRLWRDWGFSRCVQRIVKSGEFDLVQSHERIPGCALYRAGDGVHATWLESRALVQGKLARLATSIHPWHRFTLRMEAQMFSHPSLRAVICNSAMVKEDIHRRFGFSTDKLHVIHNGVDLEHFHPGLRELHRSRIRNELGIAEDTPLFLFVGSGFERKGLPQLLSAFHNMRRTDAHLVVVGSDKRERAMRNLAEIFGISARVHFKGGQQDVRPFYGAADAFALPTLYDPFPNAALEALACGLPVLTSTSCGAAELIESGSNGYVCTATDTATLAMHLDALAEGASVMREAARATAQSCALPDMVGRLTTLYAELLAKGPAQL